MPNKNFSSQNSKKSSRFLPKRGWILIACAVVVIGTLAALELTNTTHFLHKQPTSQKTTATTNQQATQSNKEQPSSSGASPSPSPVVPGTNDAKIQPSPSPNVKLIAPTISINSYQVSATEELASTCTSNAGVYCKFVFTKGGVSKSLSEQLTDAGGNAAWAWKPEDIGLTPGTWHIKAVASYGSQTKTTNNDPLTLEVQ